MTIEVPSNDLPSAPQSGAVIEVPLNKLKASPRNARKVPHGDAAIQALAASIAAKGVLQAPVVEPETDAEGAPTGFWLVTIGEGRRLALKLLAKGKQIAKTAPVRCVVDLANDPAEISLDENVTRSAMHPADQFEAFRDLGERRGWGAEEIAARFGVSAQTVRQRLRLGAVSAKLMALYREDGLTLDQLMAFAVSEDHARQEQVLDQYGPERPAHAIRRAMTEAKVSAQDRRARFIGAEAYLEAGGTILRDLFTEDGGGWFEDVALLDRLAVEKLADLAETVRAEEGWKWAQARIDYPHAEGLARVYPHRVERSEAEQAEIAALGQEYDRLISQHDGSEEWPAEVEARLAQIDADLTAFDAPVFDPEEIARGGLFAILGQDGVARIERGFVRPEDEPAPEPEPEKDDAATETETEAAEATEDEDAAAPLSDRLVLDLTAQRTMALREAVGSDPTVALSAVVHTLALATFYAGHERAGSCLEIKPTSLDLAQHAPGIEDGVAGRRVAERHAKWAGRLPREPGDLWAYVSGLGGDNLLGLLAHCASLTLNAVRSGWERRPIIPADQVARAVGLDMASCWSPTVDSYLGRVTKARIAEAVSEAVSPEAAARIEAFRKADMAREAEALLEGKGWLPVLLRAPVDPAQDAPVTPLSQAAA